MSTYLKGSATVDPASLTTGISAGTEITVTGAVLGDFVPFVSFSLDLTDITLTAAVTAADTVTVLFSNVTAGTLNLAEGTVRVIVVSKAGQSVT